MTLTTMVPAHAAAPVTPEFGATIEEYAEYDGMDRCKPKAKRGVVAFEALLQAAYPDTTWMNISRACDVGGDSEHKEGRALDWSRDASDPAHAAQVTELLDWLLATDVHGNTHAMARRLGIMYVIWDRQMWSSWDGEWEVYCIQKRRKCKDTNSKAALHPHDDHVHFSFGWPGARMKTSFWHPEVSFVPPVV